MLAFKFDVDLAVQSENTTILIDSRPEIEFKGEFVKDCYLFYKIKIYSK